MCIHCRDIVRLCEWVNMFIKMTSTSTVNVYYVKCFDIYFYVITIIKPSNIPWSKNIA